MTVLYEEKKHLSAKGMLKQVRLCFEALPQSTRKKGAGNSPSISLADCLMSGLAVFGLKFPSLLQFDHAVTEETVRHNLCTLYGVEKAPCDTQLRERLDRVDPYQIRGVFKKVFSLVQRGKALDEYRFIDNHYLLL